MRAFLDSSALAKRYIHGYVREPGAARVCTLLETARELLLSVLAVPEVVSALNRLCRESKLTREQYEATKQLLVADVRDATIVALTQTVLARSVDCLEQHPLRASDAIHVSSALEAGVDCFVSADRRQCEAARAMGLSVEEVRSEA